MAMNYRFTTEAPGQYAHSEDILPDSQRYKDLAAGGVEFAPTVKVEKPVKENLPGYEWTETEYGDWAETPIKKKSESGGGGATDTGYTEQNAAIDEEIASLQSNKSKLDAEMATIDSEMHPVIQNLKATFDKLIKNQEIQNKGILGNVQTAQFRSGRARFAPELASGNISAELSAGMGRISGLNSEMAGTISKAKEVLKSGANDRFTKLNDYMSKISDLRKEKNQALIDMEKRAREAEKAVLENSKTKLEMQKLSQDVITNNLDSYASGFVEVGENGEVSMASPEQIQKFAEQTGYNYEQIVGAVRKKAYDLSKLSQEDRKRDLDLKKAEVEALNAGLSNAETEWQNATKRSEFKGSFLQWIKEKARAEKVSIGGVGLGGDRDGKYKTDLDAIIGATLSTISTKFGQQQFQTQLNRARNDADRISLVASQVLKGQSAEIKNDFNNQTFGVKQIDNALALLNEQTKTGVIQAGKQYVFNLAGKDFDPNLAKINGYLISAIQPYRNSITGAAWGEQEDDEYQALFGSTKYSPPELKQRLLQIKEIMKAKSVQALNSFVNPLDTYGNVFEQGDMVGQVKQAIATDKLQGADGFISPENWGRLKAQWTSKGKTEADFNANFSYLKNPKNKNY